MKYILRFFAGVMWLLFALVIYPQHVVGLESAVAPPPVTFETGHSPTLEIHVATTGNDLTGDGSATYPYRTIARGIAEAVPGAAVRIHAGTYPTRVNISDLSGTANAPIWIGGAPGEAKPVIENATEGMHLTRVHYLIIHDLEVRNTTYNGINTDDGGDYSNYDATRHVIFRDL